MKSFPMFIRTTGRQVLIAGGGEQAAQKARLLLKSDANVVLVAPDLDDELAAIVDDGRATWHAGPISVDLFEASTMAFIATGCPGVDASLHAIAQAARCPVNIVDQPELCDLTTPSIVDRDPVVVAIGTEGTAPVLARQIKTEVERLLPPGLGGLAALAGRLRASVATSVPRAKRRAFWSWVFSGAPRAKWVRGSERDAAREVKAAIAAGHAPEAQDGGSISLVGAGPGASDLLTLRAVERLQEADVIFYDRLVYPDVLELARRDAERVFVGKHVGHHTWPQERINAVIVAEAKKGRRVVRLKSGDPGIFGRATEELDAANAHGIPVDIVPGVTAASAAGAALGRSLTERGVTDALVLATGTGRAENPTPDCVRHSGPGTTSVFYMSVRNARTIQTDLISQGLPRHAPVSVAANVTKADERTIETTLGALVSDLETQAVDGCAVIIVSWPSVAADLRAQPLSVVR